MGSVLVLGGTAWLGRTVAESALAAGHEVVCLARGQSGSVAPGASLVVGDRDDHSSYAALPRREWDLVVDVARQPGQVRSALEALSDRAGHWALVSSCSAYASQNEPGADERAAVFEPLSGDNATPEEYGPGKVACERAVESVRGVDGHLTIRAGLIVGSGDGSERFGYWPSRFALAAQDGGPVLVPERLDRRAQWVHVQDLASWIVDGGLGRVHGVYNGMGRSVPLSEVLDAAAQVAGHSGELVRRSDEALIAAGVESFMGPRSLPVWIPDEEWNGFLDRDSSAAERAGLWSRPLIETMADCLEWERSLGLDRERRRAGLNRSDELSLLGAG